MHSEQYVFPRSDKRRNFFKKVNVVFAVRFAIDQVFAHVSAEEAFCDNIGHDLAEYFFHVDWTGTLGDFLIDLVELEANFLPDGRYDFIEEIVMKDGWDDSSFAFPSFPFSKNHSSTGKSVEDLSDEGIFNNFVGLVEEVFDEFGIRYDDGLRCEDVSDNYVVLGPFSLENVKIALILSEILLNVVTHKAQRKQLDFVS